MAITARLIGKLGGADIEAIPVSMSGTGRTDHLLHQVIVPSGERRMVVLEGVFVDNANNLRYNQPVLVVGDIIHITGDYSSATPTNYSVGGMLTQTGNVSIRTVATGSSGQTDFSGTLYIIPFD